MILQKEKRNLCGQKCICENHNMCLKKNIVYKITCTPCNDTYIGETSRTIRTSNLVKFINILLRNIKDILN